MPRKQQVKFKVICLREDGSIKPYGEVFSKEVTMRCNRILQEHHEKERLKEIEAEKVS